MQLEISSRNVFKVTFLVQTFDDACFVLQVMVHETCHLFCLSHCVYYSCAMNGSNHLEEATKRPMFLCPICLLKLKMSGLHFDLKDRYSEMLQFFKKFEDGNFVTAAHWLERVLQKF